jgi:hypothetical protein
MGFDLFSTRQSRSCVSSYEGRRARGGRPSRGCYRRSSLLFVVMWSAKTHKEDGAVGLVTISAHGWDRDLGLIG